MTNEFGHGRHLRVADSRCCFWGVAATLFVMALAAAPVRADSAAAKNREGNRLFEQGRYGEAEKAYREAGAAQPDRPELLYNLGNALLKQNNLDSALRELREAAGRGEREIRARAWYNTGNGLFETRRFREAADAYAQALRIDSKDVDAKHNLELALRRQEEQQKQQKSQQSQDQPQTEDPSQGKKDPGQSGEHPEKPPAGSQSQPENQEKPADPRTTSSADVQGSFSKERALQILDALKNQELVEQRKLLEARARRKSQGRDW